MSGLLTPGEDVAPTLGSKVKTTEHTTNGLSTSQEQSASALNSTDTFSLLEKLELLRKELHLLVEHAGYQIGASRDLEGDGDPEKVDHPRIESCLSQMSAILESFNQFRSECDQSSLPRLQALLGKAGVVVDDDGTLHVDAFGNTRVNELTHAEKSEIRTVLSGETHIPGDSSETAPPVIDVSGVVPCKFCSAPISSTAKFCSNCGKGIKD